MNENNNEIWFDIINIKPEENKLVRVKTIYKSINKVKLTNNNWYDDHNINVYRFNEVTHWLPVTNENEKSLGNNFIIICAGLQEIIYRYCDKYEEASNKLIKSWVLDLFGGYQKTKVKHKIGQNKELILFIKIDDATKFKISIDPFKDINNCISYEYKNDKYDNIDIPQLIYNYI